MSHKYPYRRTPSDTDLRPDPGPYSSSDLPHASPGHNFYRPPPQESHPSSYQSSSSSRGSAQWSQDGALSILSSCGLEPSDLSLLAELPEDVLTVESLPHVLKQIKGKRGTIKPFPPNAPPSSSSSSSSYPPSSTRQPAATSSSGDWDQLRSQPVQYPLDRVAPSYLPSEQVQDRWGNPRTSSSVRADHHPPSSSSASSSSSMYVDDFHHRPGPSAYGKAGRATSSASSQDRASFRSPGQGQRTRPSHFSERRSADHRSADHRSAPQPRGGHRRSETSSIRSSRLAAAASMPSPKETLDFHGTSPQVFPYSCSLCDITVLSERVWIKHINGPQHADGQLGLLQQFPNWDCRMETVSRADNQSEKRKDEEKAARPPQTANQSQKLQPNKPSPRKASEKGKVVCVKFPAQSVDETYLRKLTEPFGKIVKILMFPSLAFVELGSVDQAKDLVKFHVNYPPTVNGEQIEFSISNTFNFLQSSRVVSFTPAPTGGDGQSDLISVIKRFGPPLYTLFLPSIAFVEMKNAPDAQKLVDYYSSNTLRINSDFLKVSFSGEYKSLMRVASAKRYEEEEDTPPTKRRRTQSQEEVEIETKRRRRESQEEAETETKRRSSSKDRVEERKLEGGKASRERRSRSRSGDKSSRERRSRSRSRDKSSRERRSKSRSGDKSSRERRTRSRSRDKSSRERRSKSRSGDKSSRERRSKSRSGDKSSRERRTRSRSGDKSSRDRRSRSRSRNKSSSGSSKQNGSREKTEEPEKPDSESRTDPEPAPVRDSKPETAENEQSEDEAESSADDSDIEGMEVIGEDGENLEEEDVEHLDDAEEEDEEEEEEAAVEGNSGSAESRDSPEEEKEKEVKDGETDNQEKLVTEEEKEIKEDEEKKDEDSETTREPEEAAETQDEEEEPGFPVDLEDCIIMDEVEEDQSDDPGTDGGEGVMRPLTFSSFL
uniref:Serine/arginine repetitive matrix protein 2-like n=2 Tax=Seriola lalandi dorsalis TaxID=1841481 RepID=A0A3B4WX68_SERLL